jgi:signal transduction histidine kinase
VKSYRGISYLTAGLLFGSALLRLLFNDLNSPILRPRSGLLAAWLILFAIEAALSRRWPAWFPIYLASQTTLILVLLFQPLPSDYFAILFGVHSMQIMQRFSPARGAACLGLFTALTAAPLVNHYGASRGIAFALVYTALDVFLAFYALAARRAQEARDQNQTLAQELLEANRQLQAYSARLEKLAATRERHHLARELHDSVTQTIFSMTLTTQSAMMLMERDPGRVKAQLDRLNELAGSTLAEMQTLIAKLRPEQLTAGGLAAAIRRHLAERRFPDGLSVLLEVEGDGPLERAEELGLFRIVQEALNNIAKHARTSQARLGLHLAEPFWIEIEDQGQGFDLRQPRNSGQVGLVSMSERAAEIGWDLRITTSPGGGTRIRVEKLSGRQRQ